MKRTQAELHAVKAAKESEEKKVKETQMEREAGGAALAKAEARLSFALEMLGKSESAQLRHEGFYISAARGPVKQSSREGSPRKGGSEHMEGSPPPVVHPWQAFQHRSSTSRESSPLRMSSPDKSPRVAGLSEKANRKSRGSRDPAAASSPPYAEPPTPHGGARSRRANTTARKPLKSDRGAGSPASRAAKS